MRVALVLARKESKRIKNKNRKNFCGKPMLYWPISTLKKTRFFDKIFVSTDCTITANLAKKYSAEVPFLREKRFCSDKMGTLSVVQNFLRKIKKNKKLKIESLCCVYASSPFFTVKDIKESYQVLIKKKKDFVFLSTKTNNIFLRSFEFKKNKIKLINEKFAKFRSQDLPESYIDCGQFYWAKKSIWLRKNAIYTNNAYALRRDKKSYIDINTLRDWNEAKKIFKKNERL